MRTTVILDDRLAREAKERAARSGMSLSQVVSDALRAWLKRPARPAAPFEITTFGGDGPTVHHEPADFWEAVENDDRVAVER